jgi:hypothetical protein
VTTNEIAIKYQQGMTFAEFTALGVWPYQVNAALLATGTKPRRKGPYKHPPHPGLERAIKRYLAGGHILETATSCGMSYCTLTRALKRAGKMQARRKSKES